MNIKSLPCSCSRIQHLMAQEPPSSYCNIPPVLRNLLYYFPLSFPSSSSLALRLTSAIPIAPDPISFADPVRNWKSSSAKCQTIVTTRAHNLLWLGKPRMRFQRPLIQTPSALQANQKMISMMENIGNIHGFIRRLENNKHVLCECIRLWVWMLDYTCHVWSQVLWVCVWF